MYNAKNNLYNYLIFFHDIEEEECINSGGNIELHVMAAIP